MTYLGVQDADTKRMVKVTIPKPLTQEETREFGNLVAGARVFWRMATREQKVEWLRETYFILTRRKAL